MVYLCIRDDDDHGVRFTGFDSRGSGMTIVEPDAGLQHLHPHQLGRFLGPGAGPANTCYHHDRHNQRKGMTEARESRPI